MHNYAYKCVLLRLVSRVIALGCDHAERGQASWLFIYCSFLLNVCFSVMLSSSSSSSSSSSLPPTPSSSSSSSLPFSSSSSFF